MPAKHSWLRKQNFRQASVLCLPHPKYAKHPLSSIVSLPCILPSIRSMPASKYASTCSLSRIRSLHAGCPRSPDVLMTNYLFSRFSFIVCRPSSVLRPPSSVLRLLSSVLRLPSPCYSFLFVSLLFFLLKNTHR